MKVVFIGVFVTSPWDVSDEIGHMGYIKELATGKGIPVLMETMLDEEMWLSVAAEEGSPPSHNWIAQHPPLYYVVMVPSYWLGSMFGDTFESPLYAGRMWNGFMMVLALYFLFRMVREYAANDFTALSVVAMVGSIPLISQTAAGVTNDTLVILLSIALAWRWMCFYKTVNTKNLLILGLVIGLCGICKYTFLPYMAAVSTFVVWYLIQGKQISLKPLLAFVSLAWLPLVFWIIRNLVIFGKALPADLDYLTFETSTDLSVVEYLRAYPFFTHLFRSFWGIFGWLGSGQKLITTTMHLPVIYQFSYALLVTMLAAASIYYLFLQAKKSQYQQALYSFVGCGFLTVLIYHYNFFPNEAFFITWMVYLTIFSCLFAVSFGIMQLWLPTRLFDNWRTRIQLETIIVCSFFLFVLILKLHDYGNNSGMLRGTHGRYFFSGIGCLLIAWIIPGLSRFPKSNFLALPVALLMTASEFWLWIAEVIPFFESR